MRNYHFLILGIQSFTGSLPTTLSKLFELFHLLYTVYDNWHHLNRVSFTVFDFKNALVNISDNLPLMHEIKQESQAFCSMRLLGSVDRTKGYFLFNLLLTSKRFHSFAHARTLRNDTVRKKLQWSRTVKKKFLTKTVKSLN